MDKETLQQYYIKLKDLHESFLLKLEDYRKIIETQKLKQEAEMQKIIDKTVKLLNSNEDLEKELNINFQRLESFWLFPTELGKILEKLKNWCN